MSEFSQDSRNYTRAFMTEFIELYRSFPSVWKVKSKEYSDRNKKNAAYDALVSKLKEVEIDADRDMVVKKINNLRSAFRRELKKVQQSKRTGCGTDEVYTPSLWYYDLLFFLQDQELPRPSMSNMEEPSQETDKPDDLSPDHTERTDDLRNELEFESEVCNTLEGIATTETSSSSITTPSTSKGVTIRRSRKRPMKEDPLSAVVAKLQQLEEEDATDATGKVFADKLRCLDPLQRIYAEKLISDVFFDAQLKNLSRYTRLTALQDEINSGQSRPHMQQSHGTTLLGDQISHQDLSTGAPRNNNLAGLFLQTFNPNENFTF